MYFITQMALREKYRITTQEFRVFENPTMKELYLFMTGTLPPLLSG